MIFMGICYTFFTFCCICSGLLYAIGTEVVMAKNSIKLPFVLRWFSRFMFLVVIAGLGYLFYAQITFLIYQMNR